MTEAERLADYARKIYGDAVAGERSPEAVGRKLIAISAAGPRYWTGIRILRELGILDDSGDGTFPDDLMREIYQDMEEIGSLGDED
jgi:hypothetical protein